ncbi:MAG: CAP domain-containing protein [Lachnospiraceae bacterium]
MKKNVFLSMALLSAVVAAGSTPLTSHAAYTGSVQCMTDGGYQVYIGQGTDCLSQVLKDLCTKLENNGSLCPDAPKPPVTETPDTPQEPDTDTSEENTPLSYAEQVVNLVNEERAKAGLPALTMDADITAAANVRAKEIKQQFSHTRPDGSSFSTVLKEQGVAFRGSGENIAWGQKSPEQVMNGWMNSEGHRANILNKNFKNIGVGYYQDENGVNHWVQLFTY